MTILETQNLNRSFGGLQAVDNVSFNLDEGEIRAIIGPNGAGKTTFVSLLSGRITASSGSVSFRGEDITSLPPHLRVRKGIAYTFQITSIYPKLTAFENVAIAVQGCHRNANRRNIEESAFAALEQAGLSSRSGEVAGNLAYGHQRLLEVAMGLALTPSLLILDEPTQGLSDSENEAFCTLVRDINRTTTILLIEHNMSVVMELAHRITVMDRGAVLAEGTPGEIRENDAVQSAYLGS